MNSVSRRARGLPITVSEARALSFFNDFYAVNNCSPGAGLLNNKYFCTRRNVQSLK